MHHQGLSESETKNASMQVSVHGSTSDTKVHQSISNNLFLGLKGLADSKDTHLFARKRRLTNI